MVADKLLDQEKPPEGFGQACVEISQDDTYGDFWRFAVIRQMFRYYEKAYERGSPVPPKSERALLAQRFATASGEVETNWAGESLYYLRQLARKYPEFNEQLVTQQVVKVANHPKTSDKSLTQTFEVAATMRVTGVLPAARKIAVSDRSDRVRIAAISVFSKIGTPQDIPMLEAIAADKSAPKLHFTANRAIKQIDPSRR